MRIAVGSDESTQLTDTVVEDLRERGHDVTLFGPLEGRSDPWPQVGQDVGAAVATGDADQGVLFCWTGTGVSIAANKVPGIRAALCHDAETARGARIWNHANVLVMSLRATPPVIAREMLDAWFATPPGEDAEDQACVEQVAQIEARYTQLSGRGLSALGHYMLRAIAFWLYRSRHSRAMRESRLPFPAREGAGGLGPHPRT